MIFNKIKKQNGVSLVETIAYIAITAILLVSIIGLMMNVFNTRKNIESSNSVHHNARFIVNFLSNRIHNVDYINNVDPDPAQLHFYEYPDNRYSLIIEDNDLIWQETKDIGEGFPNQSTAEPILLNSKKVHVSDLILIPISDGHANENRGIKISFTLTFGNINDSFSYTQKTFNTFIGLR
jgi:Tfp pilus assembly protein PilW